MQDFCLHMKYSSMPIDDLAQELVLHVLDEDNAEHGDIVRVLCLILQVSSHWTAASRYCCCVSRDAFMHALATCTATQMAASRMRRLT